MDAHFGRRAAVTALIIILVPTAAQATDAPEELTIRGQTHPLWPLSDLRDRGYDLPDIPHDENAAWVYIEAVNAYTDLPEDLTEAFDYALKTGWPSGAAGRSLAAWLDHKDNRRALQLAQRAANLPHFQFPYLGNPDESIIALLLPSLGPQRMLAKMAVVEGNRLLAKGEHRRALEHYLTACRQGGHLSQGITLIESLVGVACWAVGDTAVREMVLRSDLSTDDLERVLTALGEVADLRPTVQRGLRMERRLGTQVVDEFASHPSRILTGLHGGDALFGFGGRVRAKEGWGALEARLGRLILPDETMKRHMTAFYDENIRQSELPFHEADWTGDRTERILKDLPQWNFLAHMLLPSFDRAILLSARLQAETRMTQVAAALRLFALRHEGRPPEGLDELTELVSAPEVLIDPFSGRPFVYRTEGRDWVFYTIGGNLVDDGGQEGKRPWTLDRVCRYPPAKREPFRN
ncbi:MAG: hypothetical protein GY778_15955 [bacterium]|nr:hypothetical protein [bacterium]